MGRKFGNTDSRLATTNLGGFMTRSRITAHDLMDSAEVAEAFGVAMSSLSVAVSSPDVYPSLANRLPPPLRKVGRGWVWLRADIEKALEVTP
jgi:hypothetical protein